MDAIKYRLIYLLISMLVLSGCGASKEQDVVGPPYDDGPSVASKIGIIDPGDTDCPYGGILVETGIDENQNGLLDAEEVDETEKVCHGNPGSLVTLAQEPEGANCDFGGIRIDTGVDADRDSVLDESEITSTEYVCNGRETTFYPDEGTKDSPVDITGFSTYSGTVDYYSYYVAAVTPGTQYTLTLSDFYGDLDLTAYKDGAYANQICSSGAEAYIDEMCSFTPNVENIYIRVVGYWAKESTPFVLTMTTP